MAAAAEAAVQRLELEPAGGAAHYYRAGSGPPLLFLHPVTGIPRWGGAAAALSADFDVIAPYQPGWGPAKDDLEAAKDGLDLALFNADLLETLGASPAHVVGVSIGAWIGAELAAIRPDAVASLTLVNPLGIWSESAPGEDLFAQHPAAPSGVLFSDAALRAELLMEGRDQLDAYVGELLDLRASAKYLWPLPDTGVERRLPRIRTRTLVVTSKRDKIVSLSIGDIWRAGIRGATQRELAESGHLADLEAPDELAALVREFAPG